MAHTPDQDRDAGVSAGIVRVGDVFPILGLPSVQKNNYYGNNTIGYRNFLLTGIEEVPPLKMQVVASSFMRPAARFLNTEKLQVFGNGDEFVRDGVVSPTGEISYGVAKMRFPTNSPLLRLRLQVSMGHITYEANPNYRDFFDGSLAFRHFYITNKGEDDSLNTLLQNGFEPLMAVLDNSEEAYQSSIGDGKPRFELVGDIKKEEKPGVRGRFYIKDLDPEKKIQFLQSLIDYLNRTAP